MTPSSRLCRLSCDFHARSRLFCSLYYPRVKRKTTLRLKIQGEFVFPRVRSFSFGFSILLKRPMFSFGRIFTRECTPLRMSHAPRGGSKAQTRKRLALDLSENQEKSGHFCHLIFVDSIHSRHMLS